MNEHIDELCSQLDKLQFYHFVSKAQAAYLRGLKDDKCFVFLDFAENYRYVVRDSVQGFHWNNSGTTLHTFAAYYKEQNYLNSICTVCHQIIFVIMQILSMEYCCHIWDGAPSSSLHKL